MHAQSQPRPRPANPERAYGVRKTGARARAFALLAPVFALMALTLPVSEAHAQAPTITSIKVVNGQGQTARRTIGTGVNAFIFEITFSAGVTGVEATDFNLLAGSTEITALEFTLQNAVSASVSRVSYSVTESTISTAAPADQETELTLTLKGSHGITATAAGNTALSSTLPTGDNYEAIIIDRIAPTHDSTAIVDDEDNTLTPGTDSWKVNQTITATWTFSEKMKGLAAEDLSLAGSPAGLRLEVDNIEGNDEAELSADLTLRGSIGAATTVTVHLDETGITDIAGNNPASTTDFSFTPAPSDTLTLSPDTISEDGGVADVTVSIPEAVNTPTTVTLAAAGGSTNGAASGDYTLGATSLTIDPGFTSASTTITAVGNDVSTANKTVVLTATAGGEMDMATLTLVDNDLPVITIAANVEEVEISGGTYTQTEPYTLTRTGDLASALTVNMSRGFSGLAFLTGPHTVTFAENSATAMGPTLSQATGASLPVEIQIDYAISPNPNYLVGTPGSAFITLKDSSKSAPGLLTTARVLPENGGTATLKLVLAAAASAETRIPLEVAAGSVGVLDTDFRLDKTMFTIEMGETESDEITLTPVNNERPVSDNVTFGLQTAVVGSIGQSNTVGFQIADDDAATPPTVTVAAPDPARVTEGTAFNFTLSRTGDTAGTLDNIRLEVTDREGMVDVADVDFAAGSRTATHMITNAGDTNVNGDTSVTVRVLPGTGYTAGTGTGATASVAIADDDSTLRLIFSPPAIDEGATGMLFAELSSSTTTTTAVTLAPPSGSPLIIGSNPFTIPANQRRASTTVRFPDNSDDEAADPTFMFTATATVEGRELTTAAAATLTVMDNDDFGLPSPIGPYTFPAGQAFSQVLPQAVNFLPTGAVSYTLTGPGAAALPTWLTWTEASRTISATAEMAATADTATLTYQATYDRMGDTSGSTNTDDDVTSDPVEIMVTIEMVLADATGALASGVLRFEDLADPDNPVTFPAVIGAPQGTTPMYTLTRADGTALPEWLMFDATTRILTVDMAQARGRVFLLYTATAGDFTATLQVAAGDDPERRADRLGEMVGAVGRTLGWDIAHTIRERARSARSGSDAPLRLSGVSENTTLDELISRGASLDMALNANAADNGGKGGARVWARVGHSQFDSEPLEDYEQDGELTSLHAGMDFRSDPDRLFGAAVGWHDAQVDYDDREVGVEGELELEILTVNPYASKTRDRWHTWGTVGFGVGEMTYTEQSGDNEDTSESNVTLWNAAGGLEYTLGFIGAAELSARGEGMAVSMQTDESDNEALEFGKIRADAYGVRGEVEVGLPIERADGGTMRPFAVLGMRWEDGDGDADGLSAELGGGITARNADFFVDASVRAHTGVEDEVADVLAWGLALGFDRANDERGLAVELNHRAGPQPWDPFADNGLAAASDTTNAEATPATLGATTRYGLDYRNGRMTPYNTLRFDGNLLTEVETGIQYRLSDLSLGLKHVYEPSANADEHTLKLIGRITF